MTPDLSAPGMAITLEGNDLIIRIGEKNVVPLMSILLHSKFSDGPRMEFLTNPYVNALLKALMIANDSTEYMARREGMAVALAHVIKLVEEWVAINDLTSDDAVSLLETAIYPYQLT